ncbi:hypothetical protein N9K99_06835, partial [Schleiferiaceae bacterium]|nr:hypothetical protein [Schleiferiaceae bacterium]
GKDTMSIYFQTPPQLILEGQGLPAYSGQALSGTYSNSATYLGSHTGSHYYYISDWQQWETAKSYAESLGGHLARPESENEMDAIINMKQTIIGGGNGTYIDIHWSNNRWEYSNGVPITFNYFQGNYQQGQGTNSGSSTNNHIEFNGSSWGSLWYTDTRPFIIEFEPTDAPVTFNQAFCDSVELKANSFVSADGPGFTEIYWTDSQGDTINGTEYKTFYADSDVTLNGVFVRSDGQTCDISSSTYSFDVFDSPNLLVTNYSGTADLLGGDTIVLVATTDAGTVSWVDSAGTVTNNDTLLVTQPGIYTAKAATANCESVEEVRIDQPIYVAKTGNNSNDGSFSNPYLTIQKGIDEAAEGQKIYVLPGTYNEGELDFETSSGIYKSVYLASDLVRIGDSTAIASTIIDADGDEFLIKIYGSNSSTIQGFTLTGQESGSTWQSSLLGLQYGASLTFRDLVIRDNSPANNAQEAQVMNVRNQGTNVVFDNVHFKDNGDLNDESRKTAFIYNYASVDFINCTWEGNYGWESVVRVQNYAKAYFENNLFLDNYGGDWGIVDIHDSYSKITFMNSTIVNNLDQNSNRGIVGIGGNNNTVEFINSVLGSPASNQDMIKNNSSTTNSFIARNSVLSKDTVDGATYSNKLAWDVDATNIMSDPQLDTDGTLLATSPAIGIATKNPVTIGSTTYTPPLLDLAGVTRPDPAGSNPDAGAYESDKAQGDLDIILTQCAYLLEATVLNSTNYTYSWSLNGTVVSTDLSYLATALG